MMRISIRLSHSDEAVRAPVVPKEERSTGLRIAVDKQDKQGVIKVIG